MNIVRALGLLTLTLYAVPLAAQDLLDARTRDLLHEALSGEVARTTSSRSRVTTGSRGRGLQGRR